MNYFWITFELVLDDGFKQLEPLYVPKDGNEVESKRKEHGS